MRRLLPCLALLALLSGGGSPRAADEVRTVRPVLASLESDAGGPIYRNSWALVIGINRYPQGGPVRRLHFAVADAQSVRALLVNHFGFPAANVTLLLDEDADKQAILKALTSLADKTTENDRVIVYFSGHGHTVDLPREGKRGYLIPADARMDGADFSRPARVDDRCIPMTEVRQKARLMQARHVLFLIDACYSGLAISGRTVRSVPYHLRTAAFRPMLGIIAAGSAGEEALENPDLGHGAFTKKLLDGLTPVHGTMLADTEPAGEPDGVVTLKELAAYLCTAVPQVTQGKQNPVDAQENEGQMLFFPTGDALVRPPAASAQPSRPNPDEAVSPVAAPGNAARADTQTVAGIVEAIRSEGRARTIAIRGDADSVEYPLAPQLVVLGSRQNTSYESHLGEIFPGDYVLGRRDAVTGNITILVVKHDQVDGQVRDLTAGVLKVGGTEAISVGPTVNVVLADGKRGTIGAIRPGDTVTVRLRLGTRVATSVAVLKPAASSPAVAPSETSSPLTTGAFQIWTNPKDGMEFLFVPAGPFTMGSDDGGDDEKPKHTVNLPGYWIGKCEVTIGQFRRFMAATGHRPAGDIEQWGKDDRLPAVNVSWHDAVAYCKWAGVRLPTEAEWEKAARGTDGREFVWGNAWPPPKGAGNFADATAKRQYTDWVIIEGYDDGYTDTALVGSLPGGLSPYGCLDMAGNVWEWCSSEHKPYPYRASDGREAASDSLSRVVRGGSFFDLGDRGILRVAYRAHGYRTDGVYYIGFRCARSAE